MVNINLLEKEKLRRKRQKSFFKSPDKSNLRFLAYAVMILAVCLAYYFHWEAKSSLAEASTRRSELQEQSAQLAAIQAEAEKFAEIKDLAIKRINAIENLRDNQRDPLSLMNSLITGVSSGSKIWLTRLAKEGPFVSLQGHALDVPSIADLIEVLERTPPFTSVEINYWEARESGSSIEFDLSCQIHETRAESEGESGAEE